MMDDFASFSETLADEAELDDETDFDRDDIPDWFERLGRLRDSKGVVQLRRGRLARTTLLRYDDVREAFTNAQVFCKSKVAGPATFPFMGHNLQGYDGPEHRRKRALVLPAFAKRKVPEYVLPLFEPIAEALVDEFAQRGEADLVTSFAKTYPMRITAQLLGVPQEDEPWLERCALAMLAYPDIETVLAANQEFAEFILPIVDARRSRPGDDLISTLLAAEVEGERLSEEEILGFLRLLFPAGIDTTWLTLGSMMACIAEQPGIHARLIANEEDRRWAVEETVRWSSVTTDEPRLTMRDVRVSDVDIPANTIISLNPAIANRDPLAFREPNCWDLDRRAPEHVGFGLGAHLCLGAFLARAELTIAVEVLMRRLPNLRLVEPIEIRGPLIRGPRKVLMRWDA